MTTTTSSTSTGHTLEVSGASLHYEVRGSGPVLAVIGAPMASSFFGGLADLLAADRTVVTYDPRGSERSTVTDRTQATTPELLAEDVHRVLRAVTSEPVALLGSSGGAVTGLALVTAHPGQLSTLIAHEPPVLSLLDDAEEQLAVVEDLHQTYLRAGSATAHLQFMLSIGVLDAEGVAQMTGGLTPEPVPAPEVPENDGDFFFANQIRATTSYRPDLEALLAAPTRIVVGVGATSQGQLANRTGLALGERLGLAATVFPGDHGGFLGETAAFAARVREVLAGAE